jgi:hypothetical protein
MELILFFIVKTFDQYLAKVKLKKCAHELLLKKPIYNVKTKKLNGHTKNN